MLPAPVAPATPRLRLRQWRDSDRAAFAAMNVDPAVMRYFAGLLSAASSDRNIDAWQQALAERGWANRAVELRATGQFIGCVGLSIPRRLFAFSSCVEIGWRLARAHWGQGQATEAARAALRVGFDLLQLQQVVSFTSLVNAPSRALMQRIGMTHSGEDFEAPALPDGSPLRRHCRYRRTGDRWRAHRAAD